MPYTPAFWYEVCHLYRDEDSGAPVMRLTSAASISHNIYCEQPYSSPDGRRVAIIRSPDFNRDFPWCDLLVADLPGQQIAFAARGVHSQIVNTAWGEHVFYWKPDRKFYRLSLLTLEETVALDRTDLPPVNCGLSISPDERCLAYGTVIPGGGSKPARFGVVMVDFSTGRWEMLYEHPDLVNPHTQFDPTTGRTLMIQRNIEPKTRADGAVLSLGTGAHIVVVDRDPKNPRPRQLPVGPPHTEPCTGHQCFIPGGDRVVLTTGRCEGPTLRDPRQRAEGNLFVVGAGDEYALLFEAPDHELFMHVSATRCGRFFIADSYRGLRDPVALVVGCFATGKYRTILRDCHGTHGPQQWGHAHAYLTADNGHVIFSGDHQGHGQVYAARVPAGFLDGLL